MADTPKRRWFQFRLRTLLVGVVLIGGACGYVARDWRIVAARKAWLAGHRKDTVVLFNSLKNPALSWPRRVLGDQVTAEIIVTPQDEMAAHELFPEAEVHAVPMNGIRSFKQIIPPGSVNVYQ